MYKISYFDSKYCLEVGGFKIHEFEKYLNIGLELYEESKVYNCKLLPSLLGDDKNMMFKIHCHSKVF